MFRVVRCLEVVEGEWLAGLGVGCGSMPGGGVGSGWGPWVYVAGVRQGGLYVVKSGGKVCVCWFGVVRGGVVVGVVAMGVAVSFAHGGVEEDSMSGRRGWAGHG